MFGAGKTTLLHALLRRLDEVVLLTAPLSALLERVGSRTDNPYGRSPEQVAEIRRYVREVEPLLRRGVIAELDGRRPVEELADAVEELADAVEELLGR
jgi:shikimate kinase